MPNLDELMNRYQVMLISEKYIDNHELFENC